MFAMLPDFLNDILEKGQYHAPINTPTTPWVDFDIAQKLGQIIEPLKTIATFLDYIMHPTKILLLLWNWTLEMSYFICLFICLSSILMYIFGHKKYAKWAPISIGIYTIINAIGSVFR